METVQVILDVNAQGAAKNTKELRGQVNKLKDGLVDLDSTSKGYSQVLQEIAKRQQKLNDINRDARNFSLNLEQQLNNVVRITGSVTAGFSAFISASALLGSESELLGETLVRVQSAMALVQGVKGLAGLQNTIPAVITGFRNLTLGINISRTALIGLTGVIGIFVAALVLIYKNIDKIIPSVNGLKKSTDEYKTSISSINTVLERNIELLRAYGAAENEILSLRASASKKIIEQSEQRLKALEEELSDTGNYLLRFSALYRIYYAKRQTDLRKQIDETKEIIKNANGDLSQIQDEYARAAIERGRKLREQAIKDEEERNKELKRQAEERLKIRQSELEQIGKINQDIEDANLSAYDLSILNLQRTYLERKALFERNGQDITNLTQQYYEDLNDLIKKEEERITDLNLKSIQDRNNNALEQQKIYIEQLQVEILEAFAGENFDKADELEEILNEQLELYAANQLEFLDQYRLGLEQILMDEDISSERRIEIEQTLQNTIIEIQLTALDERRRIAEENIDLIEQEIKAKELQKKEEKRLDEERRRGRDALLGAFSKISKESARILGEETKAGKALAIASATIDTYRSATAAYASLAGIPIVGPALGAAAAAAAVVAGVANVKAISSVKVGDEGDTSVDIPNINYEDVTDEPIQRTSNFLTSTEEQELNDLNNRPIWVSVTDIDREQNNVRLVQNESTF